MRRRAFFAITSVLASALVLRRRPQSGPVVVAGLLRSSAGLGQSARLCLAAFRNLGYAPYYVDLTKTFHRHENVTTDIGDKVQSQNGGVIIIHLNPSELPLALVVLGRKQIRSKTIIGYWHWELPKIPLIWLKVFRYVDEIWVPSHFVASAVRPYTSLPVRIVSHPVQCLPSSDMGRDNLGLPEHAFMCLTIFDTRSCVARKNPIATVRAFRMAFGNDTEAILVIKVSEASSAPVAMAELEQEIGNAQNIRIIQDKLQSDRIAALIRCADVVMSLHRSEGFGLVLAEAMLLGKAVVATAWSANMDYMNNNNSALVQYKLVPVQDPQGIYTENDQVWAEPSADHAASWLRRLRFDRALRTQLGEAARRDAIRYFSVESFEMAIRDSRALNNACSL